MVGNGSELSEDVSEVGDEAVLLAERAGVPVVCGADRVAAAQKAASTFCEKNRCEYVTANTGQPLEELLMSYLSSRMTHINR